MSSPPLAGGGSASSPPQARGGSASPPTLARGGSASSPPLAWTVRPPAQTSLARSPGLCCFSAVSLAASPHGWDSGPSGRDPWGNLGAGFRSSFSAFLSLPQSCPADSSRLSLPALWPPPPQVSRTSGPCVPAPGRRQRGGGSLTCPLDRGPRSRAAHCPGSADGCLTSSVQFPGCLRQESLSPDTLREAPPADF